MTEQPTTQEKAAEVAAAIESPAFSHSRAGTGCWREVRWIYHHDPASPSGVKLAAAGDASIVEPLLRSLRGTSPLSPSEGR
jgi:hypothetical protein